MVVGEFTLETNLLIIGGGPAGYAAAFRAAGLGVEAVVVDPRDSLGGTCLHEGCVPSKTLLSLADAIDGAARAADHGVSFGPPTIDLDGVRRWTSQVIDRLAGGLDELGRSHEVQHVRGLARFEDSAHAAVRDGSVPRVKFRRALIATGSVPCAHPVLGFDHSCVLTPGEALAVESIPEHLLVVGGAGYMGVELASIYAALGSRVTLVEAGDRILADSDPDLVRPLARKLERSLQTIATGVEPEGMKDRGDRVEVTFGGDSAPKPTVYDRIIVAVGQRPNVDALDLDRTRIARGDDGFIRVDSRLHTSDTKILAAGDVTGPPLLANKGLHQGRIAAEVVAGWNSEYDARAVPVVAFTNPSVAWCGLTEAQAARDDVSVGVMKIPWSASGRAVGMGRPDGLFKLLYDPDTKLVLGVGIVGSNAGELIAEGALALEMGAVASDLAETLHAHPTVSELISDAAREIEFSS